MSDFFPSDPPVTLPEFAKEDLIDPITTENNVVEPTASQKQHGWYPFRKRPTRNIMNWLHRFTYEQLKFWSVDLFPLLDATLKSLIDDMNILKPMDQGSGVIAFHGGFATPSEPLGVGIDWKKYGGKAEIIMSGNLGTGMSQNFILIDNIPSEIQFQSKLRKIVMVFDTDLVTGNIINGYLEINSISVSIPETLFITNHSDTMDLLTANIDSMINVSATKSGSREITIIHNSIELDSVVMVITGGASQAGETYTRNLEGVVPESQPITCRDGSSGAYKFGTIRPVFTDATGDHLDTWVFKYEGIDNNWGSGMLLLPQLTCIPLHEIIV